MNVFQEFGFVLVNACEEWTVTLAGGQIIQIKNRANQEKSFKFLTATWVSHLSDVRAHRCDFSTGKHSLQQSQHHKQANTQKTSCWSTLICRKAPLKYSTCSRDQPGLCHKHGNCHGIPLMLWSWCTVVSFPWPSDIHYFSRKNKQKVEVQKTSCQRQVTEEHSKNGQEGCNLATEDITNQTSVPMTLLVAKLLVLHRCGLSLLLLQLLWFVYDICLRLLLNWLRYLTIII